MFESGYVLAVNPQPTMLDILMIFQHERDNEFKEDELDKEVEVPDQDVMDYKDYGLAPRLGDPDNIPEDKVDLVATLHEITKEQYSKLQSRQC